MMMVMRHLLYIMEVSMDISEGNITKCCDLILGLSVSKHHSSIALLLSLRSLSCDPPLSRHELCYYY